MNGKADEVTRYYLEERDDFLGNAPLEHLMEALSQRITARTDKRFVLAVDVGCCVGGFIDRLSRVCPESNGLILGVESNPLNVEQLRGRSFSRRVEFVECALSDAEGTAPRGCRASRRNPLASGNEDEGDASPSTSNTR